MTEKTGNKIVHFQQSGDLLFRIAQNRFAQNRLDDAVNYCQRALEKDRMNCQYKLLLAQIYGRMGRMIESNRILLRILHEEPSLRAIAYYELGNNLHMMGEDDNAYDSFQRCIESNPDDLLGMDAEDMMDFIAYEADDANGLLDVNVKRAQDMLTLSRSAMSANKLEDAIQYMQDAIHAQPAMTGMQNSLALMYYAKGDMAEARRITQEVLEKDAGDIYALCNMVLLAEDAHARQYWIQKVLATGAAAPEELYKIGLTMCDVGEDGYALQQFERILKEAPYDYGILFSAGVAAYNLGEYLKAVQYFDKMGKVDLDDSLGYFYKTVAQDALAGNIRMQRISYTGQVPPEESVARIRYIHERSGKSREAFQAAWQKDGLLRKYLLWGLQLEDQEIQKLLVYMLILLGTQEAEDILRDLILQEQISQAVKETAVFALVSLGASQPYIVYSEKGVLEVQILPNAQTEENTEESHD